MATQGDSLIRKTQKGLSVLAFETTKQSRILKKRMRIAALQKEVKADLRDLGSLVYNAILHDQPGILEEEEVKLLVDGVRVNRDEIEHLRDGIARLNRAHKHFDQGEKDADTTPDTPPQTPPSAEPIQASEPTPEPVLEPEKTEPNVRTAPEPEKDPSTAAAKPKRARKPSKPKATGPAASAKTTRAATSTAKRKPASRKKPAPVTPPPADTPAKDKDTGEDPKADNT